MDCALIFQATERSRDSSLWFSDTPICLQCAPVWLKPGCIRQTAHEPSELFTSGDAGAGEDNRTSTSQASASRHTGQTTSSFCTTKERGRERESVCVRRTKARNMIRYDELLRNVDAWLFPIEAHSRFSVYRHHLTQNRSTIDRHHL